jgi:sugar lactone lactonase YvrE
MSDFATGLTMLTDLTMGPDGNFYTTQFAIFGQRGPEPNSGAVLRVTPEGEISVVLAGLPNVTAVAFDADGNGYVAINGANPPGVPDGLGAVVYYEGLTDYEGMPYEAPAGPPSA